MHVNKKAQKHYADFETIPLAMEGMKEARLSYLNGSLFLQSTEAQMQREQEKLIAYLLPFE